MSTEVAVRPIFRSAEYLAELVRRNKRRAEDATAEPREPSPFPPLSSFILPDGKVIECETAGQ